MTRTSTQAASTEALDRAKYRVAAAEDGVRAADSRRRRALSELVVASRAPEAVLANRSGSPLAETAMLAGYWASRH